MFDKVYISDFDIIASKWPVLHLLNDYIRHFVTTNPSVGVYDTRVEPPHVVSWALSNNVGDIHHLYTLDEYRHQGLAATVIRRNTNELLANGYTPFTDIIEDNVRSCALFKACGYSESYPNFISII